MNSTTSTLAAHPQRRPRSIRTQILIAVNVPLGLALIVLLAFQYAGEMDEAISLKHSGLDDEAIAIHAAATHLLEEHNPQAVQSYVDAVSVKMRNSWSPDHHIVIGLRDNMLSTSGSEVNAKQLLAAYTDAKVAGKHHMSLPEPTRVVGESSGNGVIVIVSESLTNIRQLVRREVLTQIGVLGLLGLIAAVIVNAVLVRIVSSPIKRLLQTVDEIASGELGAEATATGSSEVQGLAQAITTMSRTLEKHDRERRTQMNKARDIQRHLLPEGVQIPGLRNAHLFEPADDIAGDYYDFVPLADGSWFVCIADVTGHGVPAAMGAAMLKTLLLASSERPPYDVVSVLKTINQRFIATILPGNFATMILARWNPGRRDFTWASAGHDAGILIRDSGEIIRLPSSGLPLGIEADAVWEQQTVTLSTGDRILLYSDGVTETHSPDGMLFGSKRMVDWYAQQHANQNGDAVMRLGRMLTEYRGGCPRSDDVTLVELVCEPDLNS